MVNPLLAALVKAGPWFAKQAPKFWPMLLDTKNREWLVRVALDIASRSPAKRLKAKIDLTEAIANSVASEAASDAERERAQDWTRQVRALRLRVDMPIAGMKERRSHIRSVREQLHGLQQEMDRHLGTAGGSPGVVGRSEQDADDGRDAT